MATFIIEIIDERCLSGITEARKAYNLTISKNLTDENGNEIPNPDFIQTDEQYIQFVMMRASESYANQYGL